MIAGLMAVLMTMSLAACGSSAGSSDASGTGSAATGDNSAAQAASGDKVTLSLCWWGNQTRNDVTKKAVDLYMEQNPYVEIKVEFTDWSGYWDKLSAMAAGGNLPDIIQMDYSYLQQYQQSGQLADLSQFIDSGVIDTSKIADSVIDSGSIDGTCYALSLGSNAPMMVYDKEIVEQAGVEIPEQLTIEELYDIGQTIYEKTGVKTYYDGGINMMQVIARTQGSHLFDELASQCRSGYLVLQRCPRGWCLRASLQMLSPKRGQCPILHGGHLSGRSFRICAVCGRQTCLLQYLSLAGASNGHLPY